MSQRVDLFDWEDSEEGDDLDLLETLKKMESVLQFRSPEGLWHARRKGCPEYGHGASPLEAMRKALKQ